MLSAICNSLGREHKNSRALAEVTLECANIRGLAPEVVQQLAALMKTRFEESTTCVKRNDPDFCVLWGDAERGALYGLSTFRSQKAVFPQRDGSLQEYKPKDGITIVYEKLRRVWSQGALDVNG